MSDEPTTQSTDLPDPADEPRRFLAGIGHELLRDKAGLFGFLVVTTLIFVAIAAPLLAPYDPGSQALVDRLLPPFWNDGGSWAHVLGTDNLGRDVLSRLIFGSRISLLVPLLVAIFAGGFGVTMGLIAGYKGGRIDSAIMRVVDTQVSFPGLLLALTILAVISPSTGAVVIVLSINGWMVYARLTRGLVLSVRETQYVAAAEIVGCPPRRVIVRHILPNLTAPLLTLVVLEFAHVMLAEAALSFLGMGIQPPAISWGLDVAIGRDFLFNSPWLIAIPGLAIAVSVLGMNLFASWMRVAADPQEREKRFAATAEAVVGTPT